MAKVRYDVVARIGKYTDKDGNEKFETLNIGVVLQTDKGFFLKLKSVPIGWDGWASLYEPRKKEEAAPPKPAKKDVPGFEDFEDDIPF